MYYVRHRNLTWNTLKRPDAITSLIKFLRSSLEPGSNPLQLSRTMLLLLNVIKELSTGRLQKTRRSLQAVAPELFHLLAHIYVEKVQRWGSFLEVGGDDEAGALESLDQTLIALKVLRRLFIAGFECPNSDTTLQQFWSLTITHLGQFYTLLKKEPKTLVPHVERLIEKHVMQLSKLHVDMAKTHPSSFALLPNCVDLVRSYWGLVVELGKSYITADLSNAKIGTDGDTDEDEKTLLEKTGLKALLLLRACTRMVFYPVHSFKYQHDQDRAERNQAVELVKTQLLTDEFVVEIMELLVTGLCLSSK